MPIYARKKETEFSPAPEGLWPAVCVDVVDLGIVQTPFGPQEKIQIRWQLEEKDPKTGKRYLIVQKYTPSLHEKSKLRPMLEAWRGKKFSKEEERQFGQNPWAHGLEPNRSVLKKFVQYAHEQGYISSEPALDDLFAVVEH